MTIVLKLADGGTQVAETGDFTIAPDKMANPFIVKVTIYSNTGKKMAKWSRKNARKYIKNFVPPVPTEQTEEVPVETIMQDSVPEQSAPAEAPTPEQTPTA